MGLYESTVDAMHVPYVMPQENGSRADVRWLALENGRRRAAVRRREPLQAAVEPLHAAGPVPRAPHRGPGAEARDLVYLDLAQRGLGTASCGPDTLEALPHPAAGARFAYWIAPYRADRDDPSRIARALARAPA